MIVIASKPSSAAARAISAIDVLAVAVRRVAVERGREVVERDQIGEVDRRRARRRPRRCRRAPRAGSTAGRARGRRAPRRRASRIVEIDAALGGARAEQRDVLGRAGRARSAPSRACAARRDVELGAQAAGEVARSTRRAAARALAIDRRDEREAREPIDHRVGMVGRDRDTRGDRRPRTTAAPGRRSRRASRPARRAGDARASCACSSASTRITRAPLRRRSSIACRIFCSLILPKPGQLADAGRPGTAAATASRSAGASAW